MTALQSAGASRPRAALARFGRAAAFALLATTVLLAALALASRLDPLPSGLRATFFSNTTWAAPAIASTIDPAPSTKSFANVWRDEPPARFSATWTGSFLVARGGRYTFATISDDGSRVFVDGRLVVENGGRHGPQQATGSVSLTRGVHALFVDYFQDGGDFHMDVLWAREGESLERLPSWALTPRRPTFAAFALSAGARRLLVAAEWAWVLAILLVAAAVASWGLSAMRAWMVADGAWPALGWIAGGSAVLNAIGVWWGLPGGSWAPDEITPVSVLGGAALHFSHAWYNAYPPLHFYLLTASFSPVMLLDWFGRVDVRDPGTYLTLAIAGRLLTVVQAFGTVVALYACGARAFGRRAGLFAAALFALVAPFLYYAKTTNFDVPYLFWFALSMVFYLRIVESPRTGDVVGFAAMATFSVCTKDQAYGLFVLPPIAIAWRLWRARSAFRAVAALFAAGAVALVLFAAIHNLAFNWTGFVLHIRDITGTRSSGYRMFAPTLAGSFGLARLSGDLVRLSMGWPAFLVSIAGIVVALADARWRRVALWLIVPAASYYLAFLNVVLYTYDRFLLPIVFVLTMFGGLAVDRVLAVAGRGRALRVGAAAALFAYTFLYAAMVDVLMVRDSRYAVERWISANVSGDSLIGFTFPLQYYPRLERYRIAEINSTDDLARDRPEYFILDADYARAEPPTSDIGRMVAGLESGALGYRRVLRDRQRAPWAWLPGAHPDLTGPRLDAHIYSTLHHINPTIEVFKRVG